MKEIGLKSSVVLLCVLMVFAGRQLHQRSLDHLDGLSRDVLMPSVPVIPLIWIRALSFGHESVASDWCLTRLLVDSRRLSAEQLLAEVSRFLVIWPDRLGRMVDLAEVLSLDAPRRKLAGEIVERALHTWGERGSPQTGEEDAIRAYQFLAVLDWMFLGRPERAAPSFRWAGSFTQSPEFLRSVASLLRDPGAIHRLFEQNMEFMAQGAEDSELRRLYLGRLFRMRLDQCLAYAEESSGCLVALRKKGWNIQRERPSRASGASGDRKWSVRPFLELLEE